MGLLGMLIPHLWCFCCGFMVDWTRICERKVMELGAIAEVILF